MHSLDDDVHWLAARLARSLGSVESAVVEAHGLTLREFVVLAEVAREPGRAQLAVARAAAVDRSLMVTAVDGLEGKGLLRRVPHPTDRRVRTLEATPRGLELLAAAAEDVQASERRLLETIPARRREVFMSVLRELTDSSVDAGFDVDC